MSNQFEFVDNINPSPRRHRQARDQTHRVMWAVAIAGLLIAVSIGGAVFLINRGTDSASARKARAIDIMADFDACQLGEVVSMRGVATLNLEGRVLVTKRMATNPSNYSLKELAAGQEAYDSLIMIKCLDNPAPAVRGDTLITGIVCGKPSGKFKTLLLENCTFRKP